MPCWRLPARGLVLGIVGLVVGRLGVGVGITLALGYIRFVRAQASPPVARDQAGVSVGVAELERRVGDLEARLNAVADALRHRGER